jgi:hypothetical protein
MACQISLAKRDAEEAPRDRQVVDGRRRRSSAVAVPGGRPRNAVKVSTGDTYPEAWKATQALGGRPWGVAALDWIEQVANEKPWFIIGRLLRA